MKTNSDTMRVLERGIARTALLHKREGLGVDTYGEPLAEAQGLANGYSGRKLERLAKIQHRRLHGSSLSIGVGCRGCDRGGKHQWPCEKAHG